MRYRRFVLAAAAALLFSSQPARAQLPPLNLPGGGAYKPIPNFTGDSAGLQFRSAINDRLSGVVPVSPKVVSVPFASLGAEQDGAVVYCSDCQATAACANGGAGTWAFGSNGRWTCAPPASTAIPVVNASTFSGADMSAKIDAAVASPQCSAGCIVDDGVVAGSLQALSGPIVINRNFVTVRINGRYTYAAAAIAGGPIQVAAGTLGGGVECPLTPQWYDVANGVFPGAGGIDYEPSSGSGPIASIGNQAESVTFRGCVFYGNQNVTDGIDVNGTSPNAVQFIDNTFVGAGGTAGSPTGTAITTTNTGGGGAYDRVRVRHNRIIRWASGIHWFANTGGAQAIDITQNYFSSLSGTAIYLYNGFDANVSQNAVAFPAATQPNQIDYQFDHCTGGTFTANHDETNDVSRVGGLVQMKFSYQQGGIVAGNTLNGNTTGDGGVTNDADCLDIDSNSNSLEVVGNRCNGSANGFLNNAGSNIWYGPNYVGGMPPSARELISGTAGLLFQQPISNAWLLEIAGGSALFGQTSENPIPDPPPPAVTQFGGAGTTTHTYYIDCMDYNGGYTLASPAATITNSNSTLSATNYNQISWTQNAGCKVWHVMRDGTSGNVLIGTVTGQAGPGATLRLNDSGQAATGYAAATRNNSGDLVVAGRISDTGDGLFASNGIMSASANSGGSNGGAVSGDISLGRTASTAELFFGYGAGSSHLDYGIGTPSAFTFGADVYGAGIVSAGGDIRARNGVLTASANGGGANGGAQPGDLAIGRSASTGKAFFGFGTGSSSIDYNISNANQFTFGADVRSAGNLRADAANGYIMASNGALVASKNGGGSSGGAGAGMLNTAMAAAAGRTIYGNGTGQARIDFGNDYAGQFYFSAPIVNSCAGTVALASGSAAVNNTCLNSSRPVICTEQNTSAPSAIGCAISGTTLNIKSASSSDTSTISWWN